jgi:Family of unknown function (DUF6526)
MTQRYENHGHRPVATEVGFLCLVVSVVGFVFCLFSIGGPWGSAVGIAGLTAAVLVLLLISRTYITRLQDRIIKLEMKVRCATLLTPAQQQLLARLDNKRIAALRFASDAELPALLERASRESLKPGDIKRAIRNWVPDYDRT